MGNVNMEASQINYRGGESKMSVEEALKQTSGEAAAIAALQTAVGNLQTGKADLTVVAPAFSDAVAYAIGALVTYQGKTYRCTTAHEGEWDATDFTETTIAAEISEIQNDVSDLAGTKAAQMTIAPFFSAEASYDPGDLVYYNGLTYRCTNAHEGAWDSADFAATTIDGELHELNSNLTNIVYGRHEVASMSADNNWCYFNLPKATTYTVASVGVVGGSNILPDATDGYTIGYSYPDRGFIMIELHGTSATYVKDNNYIVIARVDVA